MIAPLSAALNLPKSDAELVPLFFVGALMFFTGIPLISVINEEIGGDKFDPSSKAIVVEGTLFVIRSCVKFCTMNVGCALSDHLGRKPIVIFFILPNIAMDLMLLFADIKPAVVFTVGALWGLTAITIPTLRAWVCDICASNPLEMVNAQGAFRGYTIGPATCLGIPVGTALALWSNPKFAFALSLAANLIAVAVTFWIRLDDTIGIMREQEKRQASTASGSLDMRGLQLASTAKSTLPAVDHKDLVLSAMHSLEGDGSQVVDARGASSASPTTRAVVQRAWPSEGMQAFCLEHAPWSGFGVIFELHKTNPSVTYLWAVYFLTFCANETYIHTLFNYLLVGGGLSPLQAAMAFMVAGLSYSVSTEQMLRRGGAVRGNLIGMLISGCIAAMIAASSLYTPLAMVCAWLFMALLPLDCSHAGTNGLLTRMYPHDRQGEVQGVLEQIATLAVIGGYPGSLLFGYFVDADAPFFWPGAAYALAAMYSLLAAALFYWHVFKNSDGFDRFPFDKNSTNESTDGRTLMKGSDGGSDCSDDVEK